MEQIGINLQKIDAKLEGDRQISVGHYLIVKTLLLIAQILVNIESNQ